MRRLTMIMLAGVFCWPLAALATDAGQYCFQAEPFIDQLTVSLNTSEGSTFMGALTAQWRAPTLYQLGGGGAVLESHPSAGSYTLDLSLTNRSTFFASAPLCGLTATLSPATLSGPWVLTCVGASAPFSVSGTLTAITCPLSVASVPDEDPRVLSIEDAVTAVHAYGLTAAGQDENNEAHP